MCRISDLEGIEGSGGLDKILGESGFALFSADSPACEPDVKKHIK
jgi:hypothetical protein